MLHGLWKLTWVELKIFLREPLGAIGTIVIPVVAFILVGRAVMPKDASKLAPAGLPANSFIGVGLPVFVSIFISISAVLSLVTIISIYREGGILKRLRATPLRPQTILTAHVIVKLLLTAATLALMVMAGRRFYPVGIHIPFAKFTVALLIATCSILSIGFLIASIVPTARFAQPIGAVIMYPMLAVCGLFTPIALLPPVLRALAKVVPLTYAVSLLGGMWKGDAWSAHLLDLAALAVVFVVGVALSAKVFRWE